MSNDPEDGGYDWVTPTQREWPKGKAPARKCTITHDEDGGYAGVEKEAPPEPGDPRFHEVLALLGELHDKKQNDYGMPDDPFANVRASEDFGVPGWVGCMTRANDKMRRLQKAAQGGTLANEIVADSLQDLAVYAIIGLILFEEGDWE